MNLRFLTAAVVVLTVAMGVGRFAYTPIIPLMQAGAGLSHAMAGFIASANLAGYLIGALGATAPLFRTRRLETVRIALVIVVFTTAIMAIPSTALWMFARVVTGIASGLAFVLGSSIVLDRAVVERRPDWIAIFYSGVGLGIVLSAIAVPFFGHEGGWRAAWIDTALVAGALSTCTLSWLEDRRVEPKTATRREAMGSERSGYPALYWWLLAAYAGNGMGYIIPATFIVAMVSATPQLSSFATASWVVVGLVAMPSTVIWNRAGIAIGRDRALALALIVMGLGAAAPIVAPNVLGVAIAATTLGGTFIGVTALANALGHELQPQQSQVAIGRLTTAFGVGQIIGPAVAGTLVSAKGDYRSALALAAVVLSASAAVMLAGSLKRT